MIISVTFLLKCTYEEQSGAHRQVNSKIISADLVFDVNCDVPQGYLQLRPDMDC